SRRQFLPRAAGVAALGAAGFVGYELPGRGGADAPQQAGSAGAAVPTGSGYNQVQSFVTRPDLHPPSVHVTSVARDGSEERSPRFVFMAPTSYPAGPPAQHGLMIVDRRGRLVYVRPVLTAS